MAEKKIVIRLNYSSDKRPMVTSEPEMITEWNIRRIVGVILILVILVGTGSWFLWKSIMPPKPTATSAVSEKKPETVQSLDAPQSFEQPVEAARAGQPFKEANPPRVKAETADALSEHSSDNSLKLNKSEAQVIPPRDLRIVRAVLSNAVYNRQPMGVIDGTVYAEPDRAIGMFYFTELKAMKGQRISHEWWHEGKLIFKKSVTVRRDPYSFYTSKLVNTNMLGTWKVYLKDSEGKVMDLHQFELLAPR